MVKSKIHEYLIEQIRYYKKSIKNQPINQDERFINYLCGKKHAFESALLVLEEQLDIQDYEDTLRSIRRE